MSIQDLDDDAILPWHDGVRRSLLERVRRGTLPHALLLIGRADDGARHFSAALTRTLLCADRDAVRNGHACRRCPSCAQLRIGSHPDHLQVAAEAAKPIRVDQIREAGRFVTLSSQSGADIGRIVTVLDAERMNINAANSLLKTLEEPPAGRLLILISGAPARLPATIRSRCQRCELPRPGEPRALAWLDQQLPGRSDDERRALWYLAQRAPLAARRLAQDSDVLQRRRARFAGYRDLIVSGRSIEIKDWLRDDPAEALGWLIGWLHDLVKLRLNAANGGPLSDALLSNADLAVELERLSHYRSAAQWWQSAEMAWHLHNHSETAAQLNMELQLDAFFRGHAAS